MLTPKCSGLIVRPCSAATRSMTALPSAASSRVHRAGIQPSPMRPHRSSAAGALPPSHTSKGSCTGCGDTEMSWKDPAGPSWLTTSPAHRRRSTGRASSIRSPRSALGIPMARRSPPMDNPGTKVSRNRPPESRSSVATALASQTRFRPGNSMVVPILRPGQAPDTQASPTRGSGPGRDSTSGSHSESNPQSAMAQFPRATISSGARPWPPALMPMRTFTPMRLPGRRPGRPGRAPARRRRCRGG